MTKKTINLISDFNINPLSGFLASHSDDIVVNVSEFGQVYQALSNPDFTTSWSNLIWTVPERVIPAFSRAIELEVVDFDQCLVEVDIFADAILATLAKQPVFVVNWTLPLGFNGYGILDWRPNVGLSNLVAQMNLRLAERLSEANNIYVLEIGRWLSSNKNTTTQKMWYAAKVPFSSEVFDRASQDLSAALSAIEGKSRKLIILDLDNTLWGGVVGETGWEGIRLGGHDHIGEAFREFQRAVKSLSNRGVQLAIVSKNDAAVALDAIDLHHEMLLRRDHFSGWRINWGDKAENIDSLLEELNFDQSAVVFIDDNPAERDRVRGVFPEMLVPEWPSDPSSYVLALRSLNCFDTATISNEDRDRTTMYAAERQRKFVRNTVTKPDEWLRQLETQLNVMPANKANISRIAQLFNKTNQLNLSTRRLNENEILEWVSNDSRVLLAISATDRFGDMGLIGVISIEIYGSKGRLVDFILSCRVMGRKVEETLIHLAVEQIKKLGGSTFEARYISTSRNRPTLDVFRTSGLDETEDGVFTCECEKGFSKPDSVTLGFDSL